MIIKSSDVHMEANSTSEFNIDYKSKSSFTQTLLGTVNSEAKIDDVKTKPLSLSDTKQLYLVKNYESDLNGFNLVSKLIIELILECFLKIKGIKLQPCACSENQGEVKEKQIVHQAFKYERTFEYSKKDALEISSKAIIKTENRDIEIDLNLSYTKEFYEKHSENIEFENISFIDPLVINYDGNINALDNISKEMNFMFDIDSDGIKEQIPLLKSGNGFLAIDKNSNGIIDNGNELFGPQLNNGFEELRAYDSDGNSWIDENDEVFKDLTIWTKNEEGENKLIALGQSGIGALYLNDISSELAYNTSVNNCIAHLKSSSIYIKEDGSAGLLTSLDFVK